MGEFEGGWERWAGWGRNTAAPENRAERSGRLCHDVASMRPEHCCSGNRPFCCSRNGLGLKAALRANRFAGVFRTTETTLASPIKPSTLCLSRNKTDSSASRLFLATAALDWTPADSNHYSIGFDHRKRKTQALNFGLNVLSHSQIHDEHMILIVLDDLIQCALQPDQPDSRQPALKNRKLKPFTIPLHDLENLSPALVVSYVIADDIQMVSVVHRVVKQGYSEISPARKRTKRRA